MKSKILIAAMLICTLAQAQSLKKLIGTALPDDVKSAQLYDVAGATTNLGTVVDSLRGKVVFINFWASWCGPCKQQLPYEHQLKADFANEPVAFLMLSTDEVNNDWLKAVDKNKIDGYSYRIEKTSKPPIQQLFKIKGIPYFVVLDKNGNIFDPQAGWPSTGEAAEVIREALKKND